MNDSKLIFLIGANVNILFIKILRYFLKPNNIIVDQYFDNKKDISFIERFNWNENDPILKYKISSLAFEILSKKELNFKINIFRTFLRSNNKYKNLFLDLQRKIYLDKVTRLLLLIGIANKLKNKKIFLLIPSSFGEIFNDVKDYLENNKIEFIAYKDNFQTIFLGLKALDKIKCYLKINFILIFLLTKIKYIRFNLQKKIYKIGLLTWNTALKLEEHKKETFGLNAVLPLNFESKDVVVYSKNNLSKNYQDSANYNNFNILNFSNNQIFKYFCINDLKKLLKIFININEMFFNYSLNVEEYILDEFPKIIYNFVKWKKFLNLYHFDISISYNDYSISDLIRNRIFLERNIQCWGYVHAMADCYLYSKNEFILNPHNSLISYSRRYYLMPEQQNYFKLSRISSYKDIFIGPLFQNYKKIFKLDKKYKKKIVISVFSASIGNNVLNPISSHFSFFESLLKIIEGLDTNHLFIVKVKKADIQISKLNKIFNSIKFRNLQKDNKILMVDDSVNSQELINISNGIISMAFTSPTFEAISSKVPAIFYDPSAIAIGNLIEDIKDFYITDASKVEIFIKKIQNQECDKWIDYVIEKIGLENGNLGIEKIRNDLALFLSKDRI